MAAHLSITSFTGDAMKPMPVKPTRRPPAPPAPEAVLRVRLLSFLVVFATALLIVIAVAGVVIVRNLSQRSVPVAVAPPAAVEPAKIEPARVEADPRRESPAEPIAQIGGYASRNSPPNAPSVVAPPVPPKPAAPAPAAGPGTTRLLESIGSLCAVQLYQSYLNVGLLADAVEHETYPKQEATQILGTIVTLSQTVDGQLRKLGDAGLEKDDVDSLERVRKASELVRNQATHLQGFWDTGEKQHIESYRAARSKCWQELQAILGLPADDKE
jgi:hypothetical protein